MARGAVHDVGQQRESMDFMAIRFGLKTAKQTEKREREKPELSIANIIGDSLAFGREADETERPI